MITCILEDSRGFKKEIKFRDFRHEIVLPFVPSLSHSMYMNECDMINITAKEQRFYFDRMLSPEVAYFKEL